MLFMLGMCLSTCVANDALIEKGALLFKKCIACHGENGDRVAPGSKAGITIGGLDEKYLIEQLKGYAAGTADNGGAKMIMYANMKNWRFSNADIQALSAYISRLPKAK